MIDGASCGTSARFNLQRGVVMKTESYKGRSLDYLVVSSDSHVPSTATPLIILLHGFGSHMGDLAGLAPLLGENGYTYVAPNAPLKLRLPDGRVGFGWTPPGGSAAEEFAWKAEEMLGVFVDEVFSKFEVLDGNAVMVGFSQGGGMTYRYGLARPEMFRGLVALSSVLPDLETLEARIPPIEKSNSGAGKTNSKRSQRVFISHGVRDELVSVDSARQARTFLERLGFIPDYREDAFGHEISRALLGELRVWLGHVLPPENCGES